MPPRPSRLAALLLAAVLLLVAAASLAGCTGDSSDAGPAQNDEGTPKPGGTFVFPLPGDPVSIEPLNAQDASGLQVAHQVFQGLTKWVRDDDGVLVTEPDIAATWESADAQTWVFHLKQGVTFQAPVSRPVTAQDFVDSWTRVTDPENQSYVAYILAPIEGCDDRGYQTDPAQGLTGVTALDDQTLQVTLRYPFADFPATLGHPVAAVTPVEYIDQVGAKAYAKKPVGTGPFSVRSWRHGKEIAPRQERVLLGRRAAGVARRRGPAHLRGRRGHVGGLRGRRARLLPGPDRPGRHGRRRARRSPTAPGRPAPGPRPPSTSSAST